MAVINIDYDIDKNDNIIYNLTDISYDFSLKKKKIFNSGNFVVDWYNCIKFIAIELQDSKELFLFSSSVDHFIMDDAPYDIAYLIKKNNKHLLTYKDNGEGLKFFVNKNEKPSWKELNDYCENFK